MYYPTTTNRNILLHGNPLIPCVSVKKNQSGAVVVVVVGGGVGVVVGGGTTTTTTSETWKQADAPQLAVEAPRAHAADHGHGRLVQVVLFRGCDGVVVVVVVVSRWW